MSSCPPPARVRVSAPSRLHFGLLSFGHARQPQFGGVGVAIDAPRWQIEFSPQVGLRVEADATSARSACERVRQAAKGWQQAAGRPANCAIRVVRGVEAHVGLGSGTQLALSVASGLNRLHGLTMEAPALASCVGRGGRSAVGTYGFLHGGLIVDAGKTAGETLAPLAARLALPESWRFLLLQLPGRPGCSGAAESRAFATLPPVPETVTRALRDELHHRLLPAAEAQEFVAFSQALYRYGTLAGSCFAPLQGGPFGGPQAADLLDQLRGWGIAGVGQTSWGPTLFALLPSPTAAEDVARRLQRTPRGAECRLRIVSVDPCGARIAAVRGANGSS